MEKAQSTQKSIIPERQSKPRLSIVIFQALVKGLNCLYHKDSNPGFPLIIKNGKISQDILAGQFFVEADLTRGQSKLKDVVQFQDAGGVNLSLYVNKDVLKQMKTLQGEDVRINHKNDQVLLEGAHMTQVCDVLPVAKVTSPPKMKKEDKVCSVVVSNAKHFQKYLRGSGMIYFHIYDNQLEAVKTDVNAPYLFSKENRHLLDKLPDSVYFTHYFPAVFDGKTLNLELYQGDDHAWLVCISDRFNFKFKTIIGLDRAAL